MKKTLLAAALLAIIFYLPSGAITLENSNLDLKIQALKNSGNEYIKTITQSDPQGDEFDEANAKDKGIYNYEYKSPKKAFLYSLLLPGLGQRYAGSGIIKQVGFLGIEGAIWGFHFKYRSDGNKKTDEFQAWADKYWLEGDSTITESYRGWMYLHGDTEGVTVGYDHILPGTKTQQYYEMIGKYDQFRGGWDDYWGPDSLLYDSVPSPHRAQYLDMRKKANDLLDKADNFIVYAVINHLVSAIDAAISARRHNRNQSGDNWSLDTVMKYYSATEEIPVVRFSYKF
ncbi:conserved exported hypothetical protein [Candidatus Zixiibacteriota bacterium]|nr:conserved exported hypothetical protein [candidate division Zixibacteria bacterium]